MDYFSKNAISELEANASKKYYVYRLVDPRTLQTFYVGKGCGNRVFQHAKAAVSLLDDKNDRISLKYQTICEIIAAGKDVICIIHRWGLSERTAYEVESALIDCYPGLSNLQSGHDSERGIISAEDFDNLCNLREYQEPLENYVIIKTSLKAMENRGSLYDATRMSWDASLRHAKKIGYVLSVINGVVKEVYKVSNWYEVAPGGRIAFNGTAVTGPIADLKGKLIPQKYRKKGAANPFMYKK